MPNSLIKHGAYISHFKIIVEHRREINVLNIVKQYQLGPSDKQEQCRCLYPYVNWVTQGFSTLKPGTFKGLICRDYWI